MSTPLPDWAFLRHAPRLVRLGYQGMIPISRPGDACNDPGKQPAQPWG